MQRYGQESEFKDRLVAVNRVSKTVKGRPQHAVLRSGGRR